MLRGGFLVAIDLADKQYGLMFVILDAPWVSGELRRLIDVTRFISPNPVQLTHNETHHRRSEGQLGESITVVRTAACETLKRKSRLTCQTSTLPDGKVFLRIHRSTCNGLFSDEWVSLQDIRKITGKIPAGKPVTAIALVPLFTDRSVNKPAFLLAALAELRLLVPMNGKKRGH
jgi:hypothetical protein